MKAFIDQLLGNINLSHLSGNTGDLLRTEFLVTGGTSNAKRRKDIYSEFRKLSGESQSEERLKIVQLPDVSKFEIALGKISALLLAFGLVKRMGNTITIERGKNGRLNKYILRIYKLSILYLKKGDGRKFWAL